MTRLARLAIGAAALLAAALVADNLDRPLAHPDEGRYSEIAREMAASGDWVTPRLNGLKYLEKPPLQYWASAAAIATLGPSEPAARLYTALCGLLIVLAVGATGARLGPHGAGMAAALALLASPFFLAMWGAVTLDMGLALWSTATYCAWALARSAPRGSPGQRHWMLAAWAAMALAVLSKGLVGIAIPAAALALLCLAQRGFAPLARLEWGYGIIVFAAITAPWFVAVAFANPEFVEFFFVREHLERFLSTAHGRAEPWWYFLPIVLAGFLPWMFALPAAIRHAWRSEGGGFEPLRLAILWSAFVVAFFSLSGSKLQHYVLPAFPPLALVLGRYLAEAPPRRLALWVLPMAFVAAALAIAAWQLPERARDAWTHGMYAAARPWALAACGALAATALAATVALRRGTRWTGIALVALGVVAAGHLLLRGYERVTPLRSGLPLAQALRPHLAPDTRIYSVRIYDQTLPFYLRRTVTLVDYTDEFALGLRARPGDHVATLDAFPAEWLRPGGAVAIMHPDTYPTLRAQGLPMTLLHRDPRRVLVRKP